MKIAVMGTGYVGLVAGTCFAELGNDVVCIDVDVAKVEALRNGIIPIYEPGLEDLVKRNVREERLSFTTDAGPAIERAQAVFIAVGTPSSHDGSADLRYVCAVAEVIGKHLRAADTVVICKSTVPIGTNFKVKEIVARFATVPFHVVSNPEFLKEGAAVDDFMKPDRIVVGAEADVARRTMDELYAPLVRTGAPIIHMDIPSAEMTKYAANAMLATRISFMNEIANLCERVGADVHNVRRGIGTDKRIGTAFLFPGVGYGGSCFPKDVRALQKTGREHGIDLQVVDAVERVNDEQKKVMFEQVSTCFGGQLAGVNIAVWGLAFKAQTDDMREAPSIVIIEALLAAGAVVSAFDPQSAHTAHAVFGDRIRYARTPYDVLTGARALLIITDWHEFRTPDWQRVKGAMGSSPVVFDGRNLYEREKLTGLGFGYYAIGRGKNPA
ncbi:MAG: UDP-glucose/GDP-mannose dehydrogenase family protein [Myxococcales bacterium]|nr:UDP-glucose/GDP-mannose dehydrogenase family protein [Myxococcales bacterium]